MTHSPSQTFPMWVHPMASSSPQTASMVHISMGCSLFGPACSRMGPPQGHKCSQEICSRVGSCLHSTSRPWQDCSPADSLPPLGIQLLWHGSPPWAALSQLFHHCLCHRVQRNLTSSALSTSSPSFFTDLGACRAVLLIYLPSALLWPQLKLHNIFSLS